MSRSQFGKIMTMVMAEILEEKESGMEKAVLPWSEFDSIKLGHSEMTIWAGKSGVGKSLLMYMLALSLAKQGRTVVLNSPEMRATKIALSISELFQMHKIKNYGDALEVNNTLSSLNEWLDGKLMICDDEKFPDMDAVIEDIRESSAEGATHYIMDNFMTIAPKTSDYDDQSEKIKRLVEISKECRVHIHLVCHNKKDAKDVGRMDLILGSSNIVNMATNIFMLERGRESREGMPTPSKLIGIKDRHGIGSTEKVALLNFNPVSGHLTKSFSPIDFRAIHNDN